MFKLALRSLLEKKIRFALTTLAVVMGVMFVVAVFALTDSLRATFSDIADDITAGVDLTVRASQEIGGDLVRPTIPGALQAEVQAVDGVRETYPGVAAFNVVIVDGAGDPIMTAGPPALGFNFTPNQFFVTGGRAPAGPGEFAADVDTVSNNNLLLGESYLVNGPVTVESFELVGVFNWGSPDTHNGVGQTMAAFELAEAQRFLGFPDELLELGVVVSAGASPATVKADLEAVLGPDYEVITQEVAAAEQQDNFDEFIGIFQTILLVFAFIAVFVSAFIINNTFQIILGQRVREIGLWRTIGATPRQVAWSVVIESALVGVISTAVGIGLGMALSVGMRELMNLGGFGLPSGPLELHPRTVLLAVAVGLGVTMAASIGPALRSRRISPIAALGHLSGIGAAGLRRRLIAGTIVTSAGLAFLGVGTLGELDVSVALSLVGVGALATFIGINVISPAFAAPAARLLGRPAKALLRVPGRLARDNAARNPRRTAATAGALMIGLSLVGLAAVMAASLEKTLVRTLDSAVEADYFIRSSQSGFGPDAGFPQGVAADLEALDEIESVVGYRWAFGAVEVNGSAKDVLAMEMGIAEDHLDGDVISGTMAGVDPLSAVALHVDPAADLGLSVGDTLVMAFPDDETATLEVAAIYEDASIFGNWVIDTALWERHFSRNDLSFASATVAGLSDDLSSEDQAGLLEQSRAAMDAVLDRYPTVVAENQVEFREAQQEQLDSLLIVITVFLGLSLVIAVVGILNTTALSVFERTREIGLLRSVGMTRRQLRRSIRWEAVIVATFGGVLGTALGLVFGVVAVLSIPDSFINQVAVPVGQLLVYVALSAVAGVAAALFPAWRAGRLDVLDAIAHE